MENTFTFSEFLQQKANGVELPKLKRKALVQGHCHHKAIMRLDDEKCVMEKIGLDYKIMDSGCCGMAGAFGYEPDKYDVSIACGERVLLPEVRKAGLSTVLMADGFSCKEQIAQATNRNALHLAEVLQMALHDGPFGPPGVYPERRIIEQREHAQKKSMQRAGMITVGVLAAAAGLWLWRKLR
jgi:Fe-S oxidoreductase